LVASLGAVLGAALLPSTASAQGFIDFLWGGDTEWGGKRQSVTFDPQYKTGQVIVSFGDRRLYLITKPGTAMSYPIAVPREQSRWQGVLTVSDKRENPAWTPTPEMIRENPRLPSWVPGGHPMNPLGVRALYLGSSTYRIHGTDAPWTIGQAVSKGCIRMFNEDVLDLYPRVPTGTKVTVTWERFTTSGSGDIASASTPSGSGSSASAAPNPFANLFAPPAEAAEQPPKYTKSMTTKYGRRPGGGQVSRAAQTSSEEIETVTETKSEPAEKKSEEKKAEPAPKKSEPTATAQAETINTPRPQ
jgi:hypothetical protein